MNLAGPPLECALSCAQELPLKLSDHTEADSIVKRLRVRPLKDGGISCATHS